MSRSLKLPPCSCQEPSPRQVSAGLGYPPMHDVSPARVTTSSSSIPAVLELIRSAFVPMEARIDPPSSMHRLDVEKIAAQCECGEVWVIGNPPDACIFLNVKGNHLYISKLAVRGHLRGQGLARRLVELAEDRARTMGLSGLELETRIELSENHEMFQRFGFAKIRDGTHEGYDRPTFIVMQKPVHAC